MAHAEVDPLSAIVAPENPAPRRFSLTRLRGVTPGLVAVTLMALAIRVVGLPIVQGTMGRDEARLALAARGILQHGLPILPDGFLYTRGVLPAYLEAATFAIFGISDQIARLTDLMFATLLVPAVFFLGRLLGGPRPALAAATIVAISPPLVLQGREAWLYSTFLFWLTISLAWFVRDAPGDRIRAGLAAAAALLSHELAVFLLPVTGLLELGRIVESRLRQRRGGPPIFSWRRVLPFWGILLVGLAVTMSLSFSLRAPTMGGATVEMREYLKPGIDLRGLEATLDIIGHWHPWLLPIAVLGFPTTRAGWRALALGRGTAPALLMLLVVLLFNSFGLVRRGEARYVLAALPFLAILSAVALDRVGPPLLAMLAGRRSFGSLRRPLRIGLLVLLVALCFDLPTLRADSGIRTVPATWLQSLADRGPDDIVVTFSTTLTQHYLGRTDFWLRPDGYAKYVWAGRSPLREVHTGATVVRDAREAERLMLEPNRGRTIWVVLPGEPSTEPTRAQRELNQSLAALAVETRRSPDGRVVLKLQP